MTGINGVNGHAFEGLDPDFFEINHRYAFVIENGKTVIFREDKNARGYIDITRMTVQDFKAALSNRLVADGKRTVQLGKYWIEHADRRSFESCGFDPNPEREHDPKYYNLFQGFPIVPSPGDWSLFERHLREVGANGDEETFEFIMSWLRLLVQRPHVPPMVAIVFQGRQGSGKGLIARWLGQLVGKHFSHVANVRHVVGNFNAPLQDCLLLFADEAVWAGDKASEGALKALITEPTLTIERKGRDAYQVKNHLHMIIATNNEWAVPMEASDRRFVIVNTPPTYCGNQPYFTALNDQMKNGGINALMWDLLNGHVQFPLRKPKSVDSIAAAWNQQEQGMNPFQNWLFVRLTEGTPTRKIRLWPESVSKEEFYDDYLLDMKRLNIQRPLAQNIFSKSLHTILPNVTSVRIGHPERTYMWRLPALDVCRQTFAAHFQKPSSIFAPDIEDLLDRT